MQREEEKNVIVVDDETVKKVRLSCALFSPLGDSRAFSPLAFLFHQYGVVVR